MFPVIDIFAGPGGLGEGFCSMNGVEEESPFDVQLSIEAESNAVNTLIIRSVYRLLRKEKRIEKYMAWLNQPSPTLESLGRLLPEYVKKARNTVWQYTLQPDNCEELNDKIRKTLNGQKNWVLVGGPPCQAYSLIGRVKNRSVKGYSVKDDPRYQLYKVYLDILSEHRPTAFLLENVKGILSARFNQDSVIRGIMNSLQEKGYHLFSLVTASESGIFGGISQPQDFVIHSENYGVPQKRHRIIILGIRNDMDIVPEILTNQKKAVTVAEMLSGLPQLRSHFSARLDHARAKEDLDQEWKGWFSKIGEKPWFKEIEDPQVRDKIKTTANKISQYKYCSQKTWQPSSSSAIPPCLAWVQGTTPPNVPIHHESRSHMDTDLYRYLFVASYTAIHKKSPKLAQFPNGLLPNHRNVDSGNFVDRFRAQFADEPSTTITSHISKDGHYYIHPDPIQCRSLTVREAARLQTFPDNYFFSGNRTEQFHQVGNAVPPFLAKQIAQIVCKICEFAGNMEK